MTSSIELSATAAMGDGLRTVTIVPDGKVETTKGMFLLDPAAGWITKLFYERGLKGLVRWNADAREAIRNGQYAYLSPVVSIDKAMELLKELKAAQTKPLRPVRDRRTARRRNCSN